MRDDRRLYMVGQETCLRCGALMTVVYPRDHVMILEVPLRPCLECSAPRSARAHVFFPAILWPEVAAAVVIEDCLGVTKIGDTQTWDDLVH